MAEEEIILIFNTKDTAISRIVQDIVSGHSGDRELVVFTLYSVSK